MSQAAAQWASFAREVAESNKVWTIKDDKGFPAPKTSSGNRAMPFWSSLARVQKIIHTVPAYAGFQPYELTWELFRNEWLPDLEKDGILVGVNWTGSRAKGYDLEPSVVLRRINHEKEHRKGT